VPNKPSSIYPKGVKFFGTLFAKGLALRCPALAQDWPFWCPYCQGHGFAMSCIGPGLAFGALIAKGVALQCPALAQDWPLVPCLPRAWLLLWFWCPDFAQGLARAWLLLR